MIGGFYARIRNLHIWHRVTYRPHCHVLRVLFRHGHRGHLQSVLPKSRWGPLHDRYASLSEEVTSQQLLERELSPYQSLRRCHCLFFSVSGICGFFLSVVGSAFVPSTSKRFYSTPRVSGC